MPAASVARSNVVGLASDALDRYRRGVQWSVNNRAADVLALAYFDRSGTRKGPAEAVNSRLEHLRYSALCSLTSPDHSSKPVASDPTTP
ncbi:hypothetical protein GCM10023147_43760 [Tsukamurella soli]|uniref:Transposase n=1 Tax=Tsukamurella soli TaxID=644556 RepID=A0ABP8K9L9_9ACTN